MGKDEILKRITDIGTCEDDVERRNLLTSLSEDITKVFDENETNLNTIDTLNTTIKENNEKITKLRESNMDLFLKVSEGNKEDNDPTGETPEDIKEKRKFEDLFDEKGGLK